MLIPETPRQLENHIDHETIAVPNVGAIGRVHLRIFGLLDPGGQYGRIGAGIPGRLGPGIAGRLRVAGRRRG